MRVRLCPCCGVLPTKTGCRASKLLPAHRFCELPGPEVCRRHVSNQAFELVLLDRVVAVDVRSCKYGTPVLGRYALMAMTACIRDAACR